MTDPILEFGKEPYTIQEIFRIEPPNAKVGLSLIFSPPNKSVLHIGGWRSDGKWTGDILRAETPFPYPNWFRRFWYWALLDWKWERVEELKKTDNESYVDKWNEGCEG